MKKKLQVLQKTVKQVSLKKKIKKNEVLPEQPKVMDHLDEDIDSDFLDENSGNENQQRAVEFDLDETEEEIVREHPDDKRIRLAKRILADTKAAVMENANEDEDAFRGVEMNEDERKINEALQNQIIGKRHLVFSEVADRITPTPGTSYFKGHTKCISSVQFDPFNKSIVTTSLDCSIIQWDLETKKKNFLSKGKEKGSHKDDILCSTINFDGKILATSGSDKTIKLWDTNSGQLINTLIGHRGAVNGLKFGLNSYNLASISADRTLKLWDAQAQAHIDTFFGHLSIANDLDALSEDAFLSCGYDRQAILWKTKYGSQLIFHGHDFSIDCVRSITPDYFMTGSQDAAVSFWALGKKKPIWTKAAAHGEGNWVTAIGAFPNSDIAVSGSYNNKLNFYKVHNKSLQDLFQLDSNGIVNNLQFSSTSQFLASVESDQHRLGRWITAKAKNRVMLYKLW